MEDIGRAQKGIKKTPAKHDKSHKSMLERRPLKTVNLSPPEYAIDPQILLDSYIEKEVRFAGVVDGISAALDSTNRTDVLRVIDHGKRERHIPKGVTFEHDAILSLSVHNVKFSQRDHNEDLLLRIPVHEVASTCYIRDDNQHILALKFSTQGDPTDDLCQLAVLYCDSRASAEELCSLIGQCFHLVYTEATIEFLDHKLLEATASLSVSSSNITTTTRSATSDNSNSNPSTPNTGMRNTFHQAKMSFMSQSQHNLDGANGMGTASSSGGSRSLSLNRARRASAAPSESDLSPSAKELLQQYMHKLHSKLTSAELCEFARLLQASTTTMPFPEFCSKLLQLYGPERKYLLAGMHPFVPEKNSAYFESFLCRVGVAGSGGAAGGAAGIDPTLISRQYRPRISGSSSHSTGSNPAPLDEYDLSSDLLNLGAVSDVKGNSDTFLPS